MSATLRQLIAIMLWLPLGALALPDAVRERHAPEGGWQQWGSAEMTWYGLALMVLGAAWLVVRHERKKAHAPDSASDA